MKISRFLPVAATILFVCAGGLCLAQYTGFRLSTNSPRPLTDLIDQLNLKYGWCVNYEDQPIVALDDLIDVTSPMSKGPGRAYSFFSEPVTVQTDLPEPATFTKLEETDGPAARNRERVAVEAILNEYKNSGNHGSFTYYQSGKYIDVYPDKMRDKSGNYVPFEPMLSTRVTIPSGHYRMDQLLWLTIDQVAQKRGIPIIHGTAPTGTFLSISLNFSASDEPAREVLRSAFEDTKAIRATAGAYDVRYFRWALLYDAGIQSFGMNVLWTSKDLPGVPDPTKYRPGRLSAEPKLTRKTAKGENSQN